MPRLTLALLLAGFALQPAFAAENWTIDPARSHLHFTTIKAGNVPETHRFLQFTGGVDATGKLTATISLESVDTAIPVRDQRLRTQLFDITRFPLAKLAAQVDPAMLEMPVDQSMDTDLAAKLTLVGVTQDITMAVTVVRTSATGVLVTTRSPVLLNANAYGLADGIEALRLVAGLPSISSAVPVTVGVQLNAAGNRGS